MTYPNWETIKDEIFDGADVPMIDATTPTFMRRPLARTPSLLVLSYGLGVSGAGGYFGRP